MHSTEEEMAIFCKSVAFERSTVFLSSMLHHIVQIKNSGGAHLLRHFAWL